jgi:hypothetical protein
MLRHLGQIGSNFGFFPERWEETLGESVHSGLAFRSSPSRVIRQRDPSRSADAHVRVAARPV